MAAPKTQTSRLGDLLDILEEHQQIDQLGGLRGIRVALARHGIGNLAEGNHRRAGQHHEEPDE